MNGARPSGVKFGTVAGAGCAGTKLSRELSGGEGDKREREFRNVGSFFRDLQRMWMNTISPFFLLPRGQQIQKETRSQDQKDEQEQEQQEGRRPGRNRFHLYFQ